MTISPVKLHRLGHEPIIHAGLDPSLGNNINGPSLIRVPDCIKNPLGRYYLYFSHHFDQHIRLAYANDLTGPWRIHAGGVLRLPETPSVNHIASPDIHFNEANREFRLYYHGVAFHGAEQTTWLARSTDGLHFTSDRDILGPFYFRVFLHDGAHYAVAKGVDRGGGGVLLRSPDGIAPFRRGPDILPDMRHCAVWARSDHALVAFSRIGDSPERLLLTRLNFTGDWLNWKTMTPVELLRPELPSEGANLPAAPSTTGASYSPVNQLRDPAFFHDIDGRDYLLYSVAGEQGIAIARMDSTFS